MTIDRNDPRWTAYVLNEMETAERAAFEKEIEADPAADEILNEIRETVGLLQSSLEPEPALLTSAQRDRIESSVPSTHRTSPFQWAMTAGIAALVIVGFVTITTPNLLRSRQAASGVATSVPPLEAPTAVAESTFGEDGNGAADTPGDSQLVATADAPAALSSQVVLGEAGAVAQVRVEAEADTAKTSTPQEAQALLDEDIYTRAVADAAAETGITFVPSISEAEQLLRRQQFQGTPVIQSFVAGNVVPAPPPPPPPPSAAPGQVPVLGGAIGGVAEITIESLVDRFNDRREREFNTEEYGRINDNPFYLVSQEPLATFSVDVDTASYANVRRFLTQRMLPPPDAVRIEEMVNYFTYNYASPNDGRPVRIHAEVASAPWKPEHRLVRIGIQGQQIERDERAASNLVFLLDVSGSMSSQDKLPLLKEGMKLLVEQLGENDRVAIVVYAGASGLVLDSTPGDQTRRLLRALDRLSAGGSTNGAAGIELAYETAVANFIEGGVNRVILATDGDFNIGITNNGALTRLIEEKAETGVFLSVLGFGTGNLNDAGMESLADQGNGNYSYIDSIREARKVLVDEMGSTLITIAKDVKFQVEFNPAEVNAYRLIGYENRLLENQDFNDDTKDAGEIGAGHTVTALFEVVPAGVEIDVPGVDPLRYQTAVEVSDNAGSGDLLTVKVRYKEPDEDASLLIEAQVGDDDREFASASADYRFASAVAAFGMILRESPHRGDATFDSVLDIADDSRSADEEGYRDEFVDLVRVARAIRDLNRNE